MERKSEAKDFFLSRSTNNVSITEGYVSIYLSIYLSNYLCIKLFIYLGKEPLSESKQSWIPPLALSPPKRYLSIYLSI
jgi:hypothetical protein